MNGTRLKSAGNQLWLISFMMVAVYCFIAENRYSFLPLYLVYILQPLAFALGLIRVINFGRNAKKGRKKFGYWMNEPVFSCIYITTCQLIIAYSESRSFREGWIIITVGILFIVFQKFWKQYSVKEARTDLLDN